MIPFRPAASPFPIHLALAFVAAALLVILILPARVSAEEPAAPFRRGDAHADGLLDMTDAVVVVSYLFSGGSSPECSDAADSNDDGAVDLSDPITLLGFLFQGTAPLRPPGPGACGPDPTPDGLSCAAYGPCPDRPQPEWTWEPTAAVPDPPAAAWLQPPDPTAPPEPRAARDLGWTTVGPVLLHSGEARFALQLAGAFLPCRGSVHWEAVLVYRSGIDFHGPVGRGWNLDFLTDRVERLPGGSIRRYDARRALRETFSYAERPNGGAGAAPYRVAVAHGSFDVAFEEDDGTITVRAPDGTRSRYHALDGSPGAGALLEVRDRRGNTLRFVRDERGRLVDAIDCMGRRISYAYDAGGRLESICRRGAAVSEGAVPGERHWRFSYNDLDQLVSVTSPAVTATPHDDDGIAENGARGNDFPDGTTYRFRYDSAAGDPRRRDNLLGVTYPNEVAVGGPERVRIDYGTDPGDPLTYDRVITLEEGGGRVGSCPPGGGGPRVPAGGATTFSYGEIDAEAAAPGDAARTTTVVDPSGHSTTYVFDGRGLELERTAVPSPASAGKEPPARTTRRRWNEDGCLIEITLPEENRIRFVYDTSHAGRSSQGNLLRRIRTADARRGGDQDRLETSYTYEPIFNRVRTVTRPRGHVTDPAGAGALQRLRYTSSWTFDYQEDSEDAILRLAERERVSLDADGPGPMTARSVARGLSLGGGAPLDHNGDLAPPQHRGNVIEQREPNVVREDGSVEEFVWTTTYNELGQKTSDAGPEGILTTYRYYPECDPDGDGVREDLPVEASTVTGGYLRRIVEDDTTETERPATAIHNAGTSRRTRAGPPVIRKTSYGYDTFGNVTSVTDGRGVVHRYRHDELNRVVEEIRAAGHVTGRAATPEPRALDDFAYVKRVFYDFNGNVIRHQVEDRGNTSEVGADNGPVAFVDTTFRYDLLDRLTEMREEISDLEEAVTRFRYDASGRLVLAVEPEGSATSWTYGSHGLVVEVARGAAAPPPSARLAPEDPEAFGVRGGETSVFSFRHDRNGNLVETSDAADTDGGTGNNSRSAPGDRTRYTFDGFDRRTSTVTPVGTQDVLQYDADGNVVRRCRFGPTGGPSPTVDGPEELSVPVSSMGVLQAARLVTTSLLSATETHFDELGREVRSDRLLFVRTIPTARAPDLAEPPGDSPPAAGAAGPEPSGTAGLPGLPDLEVLARIGTTCRYDRHSLPVAVLEDTGTGARSETTLAYDGLDRLARRVDPEGNITEFSYDGNDNLVETRETDVATDPLVPAEVFLTTYFYDSLDRLEMRVDNLGGTTICRYDSRGNRVLAADPRGPLWGETVERRVFASADSTARAMNAPGNVLLASYDGKSRLVALDLVLTADGEGTGTLGVTREGVRVDPRPPRSVPAALDPDPSQAGDGLITVRFGWDRNSLLESVTDDLGNETRVRRDDQGRVVEVTRGTCVAPALAAECAMPVSAVATHDRDGNITDLVTEGGSRIRFTYDALNRRLSERVEAHASLSGTTVTTYEYDGLSRPTRATDDNEPYLAVDDSEVRFAYDSLGRVIEEQQVLGAGPPRIVSAAWRGGGARAATTYPDGRTVRYRRDRLGRARTVLEGTSQEVLSETSYIGRDRVLGRSFPRSGARITYRRSAVSRWDGYDGLRRPSGVRHIGADGALIAGSRTDYDRAGAPVRHARLDGARTVRTYRRDSAGRLVELLLAEPGAPAPRAARWSLDGAGNWLSHDGVDRAHDSLHRLLRQGGATFEHDAAGNLRRDGSRGLTYSWDAKGRLRGVVRSSDGAVLLVCSYDALDRCVRRVVANAGSRSGVTDILYDQAIAVEERSADGAVRRQYVSAGAADGERLLVDRDIDGDGVPTGPEDEHLFYHTDSLGRTVALSDGDGRVLERYAYDVHGLPEDPGSAGNPYLVPGGRFEPAAGVYFLEGRPYDPLLGRFLAPERSSPGEGEGLGLAESPYVPEGTPPPARPPRRDAPEPEAPTARITYHEDNVPYIYYYFFRPGRDFYVDPRSVGWSKPAPEPRRPEMRRQPRRPPRRPPTRPPAPRPLVRRRFLR